MSAPARLLLFAALLAVVGGGAAAVGGAVDADAPGDHADAADRGAGETDAAHGAPEAAAPEHGVAAGEPRGLAVAAGGLRLVADESELEPGRSERFRFRVVDERGRTVRGFDVEHERRMHLIVVRRDLSGYRHLHPRQTADGAWEVSLRLDEPGAYRAYADFTRGGEAQTLGVDLTVPGEFHPRALPRPAATADAGDGYEVRMRERAGELSFTVHREGRPVTDIEPYLGTRGHLVALREGDLAYLHVHPESEATQGRDIRFAVDYPSQGRYGLFLQFRHEGRVRTAMFTRQAGEVSDGHGH